MAIDGEPARRPVLVGANEYAFRPGERIWNTPVASVCLLWAMAGRGVVELSGAAFDLVRGDVLWLPWWHDVRYIADGIDPYRLGTVHLVPAHLSDVPVEPRVGYGPGDPLLASNARVGRPGRAVQLPGSHPSSRRLAMLGGYAVERFDAAQQDPDALFAIGTLLLDEHRAAVAEGEADTAPLPRALEEMQRFVEAGLDRHLSVAEIADAGGCSESTAERLFGRWHGQPVLVWVREQRMRRAADLLTSTGLRVGEVARRVGFADPLYFSRVFTRTFGLPPSRYASQRIRP